MCYRGFQEILGIRDYEKFREIKRPSLHVQDDITTMLDVQSILDEMMSQHATMESC